MKQSDIFQLPKDIEKMDDGSNLLVKPMEVVMRESMMPYAEHVILDRALPRVEDGLKPVQRRILYSMYEQGNLPDKPTRKSARIVGDCMGRYHPHGDSSIYDAMVRMAQDFQLNVPLVHGQGNFGNIDGDSAAAMRYTEARLTPMALELLRDIEKDTVRWSRNFDDTTKEPDILPGRYPNLLVNGSTGIAVGLATNIPPHNLVEVIDGVVAFIENKNISLEQMMKIIKGPDFPTGGFVIPGEGLKQAYETGKGKILIRAKMHVEVAPGDKRNIVITEIPYGLSKADLLMKIAALKDDKDKKEFFQSNIAEIVDESDKEGMRAVIKLKKDADPNKTIALLFKYTQLEVSYGINMVAIADGKPQLMGLLDIIAYYVSYQRDVILKRSKFELEDAKARAHILEGLVVAVNNIDEVIQIIKNAASTSDAKQKLRNRFDLSERQAQAILDLRLARITKLEVNKLETELAELHQKIKRLGIIINSKKEQMNLVKTELLAIKRTYKVGRKSEMVKDVADYVVPSETDEKPVENCVVCLTADKTIKRIALKSFNKSDRDPVKLTNADLLVSAVETTTDSKLMLFTNFGNVMQIAVEDLKDVRFRDEGTPLFKLFPEAQLGEVPVSMFVLKKDAEPTSSLIVYTRQGMIKRSSWADYMLQKSVFQGFKCKDKDEVLCVECEQPNSQIFLVTNRGGCVRFKTEEVPVQTRVTGGVMGINLADGEHLVFAGQVDEANGQVLMVTDKGFCKRLAVKDITIHARNCKGAKGMEFGNNGTCLVFADYVGSEHYAIAIKDRANTYVVETKSVSVESKNHKGKLPQGKRGGIVVESVAHFYTNGIKFHVE